MTTHTTSHRWLCWIATLLAMSSLAFAASPARPAAKLPPPLPSPGNPATLRAAINDLVATFGPRYPRGAEFLKRLDAGVSGPEFAALQREALTANPLVSGQPVLFIVRHQYKPDHHNTETMFQTGEINTAKFEGGSALKTIDFARGGEVKTLIESASAVVRDPEMSFDGKKILFSMRKNIQDDYHIYECNADGSAVLCLRFPPAPVVVSGCRCGRVRW